MRNGRQRQPDHAAMLDRLLTKAEAAERLKVSPRFIERCVVERRIRYVRVGRFIRVPESAIDDFIEAGTVETASSPPFGSRFRAG
jgi:excisionase family DNA binding protein